MLRVNHWKEPLSGGCWTTCKMVTLDQLCMVNAPFSLQFAKWPILDRLRARTPRTDGKADAVRAREPSSEANTERKPTHSAETVNLRLKICLPCVSPLKTRFILLFFLSFSSQSYLCLLWSVYNCIPHPAERNVKPAGNPVMGPSIRKFQPAHTNNFSLQLEPAHFFGG